MGAFAKFVESGTDAKHVPHGRKCDLCGEKLKFLETGFWSINAKRLADGVICQHCLEKLELLAEFRNIWIPPKLKREELYKGLTKNKLFLLDLQKATMLLSSAESLAAAELASLGPEYTALFRMRDACFIEPTALQVGVVRAKLLRHKLVLFGFVQLGQFRKGDKVLIRDEFHSRKATVLEAYVYDCEENDLEVNLKAHMGRQQLGQWQTGWLVLDDEEPVSEHTSVLGITSEKDKEDEL
jgi:hypothetical protein